MVQVNFALELEEMVLKVGDTVLYGKYSGTEIEFEGETYPLVKLEISSTSHPFYTGKSKLVDTAGRVDKFMSRYGNRKK